MSSRRRDAAPDDRDDSLHDEAAPEPANRDDAADDDASAPPPEDEPPPGDDPNAPRLSADQVTAFVAKRKTVTWVHDYVEARVPSAHVWDVTNAALERALRSKWRPSAEAGLYRWMQTVTDRQIADFFRARKRLRKREVPMPRRTEAAGRYGADGPGAHDDVLDDEERDELPQPGDDAGADGATREMLTRWMDRQAAKNPYDRETFAMMREWAAGKPYTQIADERGMPVAQVNSRVYRFKAKYGPLWAKRQERERVIVLWRRRVAKGGWWAAIALAIAAFVAAFALQQRPRRDRDLVDAGVGPQPPASSTLSAPPPPGPAPFDQANPAPPAPIGPQPPPPSPKPAPQPHAKPPPAPQKPLK
jgi:DNA-directed RNA polymerase specialized sigma24 family protein